MRKTYIVTRTVRVTVHADNVDDATRIAAFAVQGMEPIRRDMSGGDRDRARYAQADAPVLIAVECREHQDGEPI